MARAHTMQKFQDWFTQQWVIFTGKRISPEDESWLPGPFGNVNGIGEDFINQLAAQEDLIIRRQNNAHGLIPDFTQLQLPAEALQRLSPEIIHFYENTALYEMDFTVDWNFAFQWAGKMVNRLFSRRISQLHLPTPQYRDLPEPVTSEIITLHQQANEKIQHTIWLRTLKSTGQIVYSGVYGMCRPPGENVFVKAVFPLPYGNATVLMKPQVEQDGSFTLNATGQTGGDAGFYFLLKDSAKHHWFRYVRTFRDRLNMRYDGQSLIAEQVLTLWNIRVLTLHYHISRKKSS